MPGYKPAPKKRKPKPKVSTQTPIFGSSEDGDAEECAECLSQTPECLKEVNKNGWTPLHQAAFSGQLAMLNTLLEKGLDVNAVCKDGDTPVHYAACQGERECVEALAAAGADLTIKDHDGETPYKVAHKSVKRLIKDLIAKANGDSVEDATDAMAATKLEG